MSQNPISLLARKPRLALLLWLSVSAIATSGCLWLKFDFSPESVYSGQDEAVEFCNHHKQLFRFEDSVCMVVLQSTDSESLVRTDCLEWVKQLGLEAAKIPGVVEVSSLLTLRKPRVDLDAIVSSRTTIIDRDDLLSWGPLVTESDLSSEAAIQDRLDRLPLLNDLLISNDRTLLLTVIALDPERRGISMISPPVSAIEDLLNRLPLPKNTRTHLSGVPPIRVDIIRSLEADQKVMVPICATLFLIVSVIMFRSIPITFVSLLAVLLAVGNAVGLMGWTGQPFNLLSNVVPPLALIIAAANSVHIVSRFQSLLRSSDGSVEETVTEVMSEMAVTCFLTLATTAIGFGSLLLARSTLLQTLGMQAVLAMACSYFSLIIVLTAGLSLLGESLRSKQSAITPELLPESSLQTADPGHNLIWRWIADIVCRRASWVACLHVGFAMAALYWASDMRVNSLMFETYDSENPVMKTISLMDEKLSGMVSLEVQLQASSIDEFYRDDVVQGLRRVREHAEADPRITFYRDYSQILAAFDSRLLSRNAGTAAAALRRIHRVTERVDVSEVTRDFLSGTAPAARIMMRVHDIGSAGLNTLIKDVEGWARQELPSDIEHRVTGDAALHAICMDVFVRDLFVSLIAASGVIFALIAVLFRSVRTGLISAVPNLFPLVITVAWMKLRGFELTAGNVIVFAISLGIAVDDTIHFLARYRQEIKQNASSSDAVRATLFSCGKAIVLTSVLIVCGLSVLIFSDFVPTRRFAELTAITMLAALPGDLVLLPSLLVLFGKRPSTELPSETTDDLIKTD